MVGMTTASQPLGGLFVPLITPFTAAGDLDQETLESLAHRMLDAGATGIVALGTTAEAVALDEDEKARVLDICARVCRDREAPLIAAAGTNDTRRSQAALAALARWPEIRAALVVVPYYNRPGEDGVLAHFRALAARTPVPIVVYNIPQRTGQQFGWPAMRQLAALTQVAGVKHAPGSVDLDTVAMMAERPDDFSVLAGDCAFAPALLALGASGVISASAHVSTASFAELVRAWRAGDARTAQPLGHRLAMLGARLFAEPNPVVIKAVLAELGHIPSATVRLPLVAARPASVGAALTAMAAIGPEALATV